MCTMTCCIDNKRCKVGRQEEKTDGIRCKYVCGRQCWHVIVLLALSQPALMSLALLQQLLHTLLQVLPLQAGVPPPPDTSTTQEETRFTSYYYRVGEQLPPDVVK